VTPSLTLTSNSPASGISREKEVECTCTGFGWDRFKFLHISPYGAFRLATQTVTDNTLVLTFCWTAIVWCQNSGQEVASRQLTPANQKFLQSSHCLRTGWASICWWQLIDSLLPLLLIKWTTRYLPLPLAFALLILSLTLLQRIKKATGLGHCLPQWQRLVSFKWISQLKQLLILLHSRHAPHYHALNWKRC